MLNISQTKNFNYKAVDDLRLAKGNARDTSYCSEQNTIYVYVEHFPGGAPDNGMDILDTGNGHDTRWVGLTGRFPHSMPAFDIIGPVTTLYYHSAPSTVMLREYGDVIDEVALQWAFPVFDGVSRYPLTLNYNVDSGPDVSMLPTNWILDLHLPADIEDSNTGAPVATSHTYNINGVGDDGTAFSHTSTVTWGFKTYWGVNASDYLSWGVEVSGLFTTGGGVIRTTHGALLTDYTFTPTGAGEYLFIAIPSALADIVSFWVSGLLTTFIKQYVVEFAISSGTAVNGDIYQAPNGNQFVVIDASSPAALITKNLANVPDVSGNLTQISGTGDPTIVYTSYSTTDNNVTAVPTTLGSSSSDYKLFRSLNKQTSLSITVTVTA